jgi:hypothetical protein
MTAETIEQETIVAGGAHELVITEPDKERSIILMDRLDLEQAMAELRGEVVSKFVYMAQGKRQLSYAGIKEAARLYRNVHFGACATPLPDGSWMITSYAHNMADNTRVDYPMPYPAFDPSKPQEAIAFRATLSKSLRNALAAVLPITYLEAMIGRWIEQQGGGQPAGRAAQQTATPRNVTPLRQGATVADVAPSTREQLRAAISPLLAEDPDAAGQMPKDLDDCIDVELQKTLAWLQRRKTAGKARGAAAWTAAEA